MYYTSTKNSIREITTSVNPHNGEFIEWVYDPSNNCVIKRIDGMQRGMYPISNWGVAVKLAWSQKNRLERF